MPKPRNSPISAGHAAEIRERIQEILGDRSVREFTDLVGVSRTGFMKVMDGGVPTLEMCLAIARYAQLPLSYILDGDDAPRAAGDDYVPLPRFDVQASAGRGLVARDDLKEAEPFLALRQDFLRRMGLPPRAAHVLTAKGESMEPTLRDGDLLVADRRARIGDKREIFVVTWQGAVLVKRCSRLKGGEVLLSSDNPAYDPQIVAPRDLSDLRVEGRVGWVFRAIP